MGFFLINHPLLGYPHDELETPISPVKPHSHVTLRQPMGLLSLPLRLGDEPHRNQLTRPYSTNIPSCSGGPNLRQLVDLHESATNVLLVSEDGGPSSPSKKGLGVPQFSETTSVLILHEESHVNGSKSLSYYIWRG